MYDFLRGKIVSATAEKVVLEVGGIGYKIAAPINLHTKVTSEEVTLFTSFVVREDAHIIFGFLTKEERDLFELLLNISGIGPKTALSIVSHIELENFSTTIASGNVALLSKIPGIGKKTAERLIMELKDKLIPTTPITANHLVSDALQALIKLGYHPIQAQRAIHTIIKEGKEFTDTSGLITLALRAL